MLKLLPPAPRYSFRARPTTLPVLAAALGLQLSSRIGEAALAPPRAGVCLGPDEWLLTTADEDAGLLEATLGRLRSAHPHSLVDISDRDLTLELSGEQALDLLAFACPRDLSAMQPGTAIRTLYDTSTVVLHRTADVSFRLDVPRSHLTHVQALLEKGMRELQAGL